MKATKNMKAHTCANQQTAVKQRQVTLSCTLELTAHRVMSRITIVFATN